MRRLFIIPVFILLLVNGAIPGFSQDVRTLETKVADILAQVPASDLGYRDQLMSDLFALGEEGFARLSSMLVVPGTGNDAAVRMAINSMARYASQQGKEKEKSSLESYLLTAIRQAKEKPVQRFLIHQLNLVGSDNCLSTLKPFLGDKELCEPATQVLLNIRTEKAARVLLAALQEQEPHANITLIKALGELQYTPAAPVITQFAGSKNLTVQRVTLQALAGIGDPASYKTLWAVADNTAVYEPTMAISSFISYLDRLGSENELKLCKQGIMAVLKKCKKPPLLSYRAATMDVYLHHFGEGALALFYKEVKNNDKAYRNALLSMITGTGDSTITKKWISVAKKSDPAVQGDIIRMLARRNDLPAIKYVKTQLNDSHAEVRQASVRALATLLGKGAVPGLLQHLLSGRDIPQTYQTLLTVTGKDDLPAVAAASKKASGEAKAACIRLIGVRQGTAYFELVKDLCNDPDETVSKAAFEALPGVSSASSLDALIKLLTATGDKEMIPYVQKAIVTSIKANDHPGKATARLIASLNTTEYKHLLTGILPDVGGREALETTKNLFSNSSGDTKTEAFNALLDWKDPASADVLYYICQNGPDSYRERAFSAYVGKISRSRYPDEQKLLKLRKIMPLAATTGQKEKVLKAVGKLHIFPALVYAGKFLDDPDVAAAAALAVQSIALPTPGGRTGMSGTIVRNLLTKALPLISGPESDYNKAQIQDYLDKMPEEEGFVSMFNGKDLSGWKGFVANPIKRAEMSKKELKKKQAEADKKMHENWSVNENSIVFNGKGQNLVSEKNYGNFELWVDWRITKGGDSGIYLRGTPQVQIWDTSRRNVGAQVGSGGLYNNQRNRSTPLKVADNPVGEWNTFHIIMVDSIVTVWLNGELVVDHVPLENYWDRSRPIFPTGPIELQAHGSNLAFRDIYIREIKSNEYHVSPEEKAEGFVPLFNGKNLDGWTGNKTDYVVENGQIVVRPREGHHGNLYTEKEYKDFDFRFEFKLTPGANNGIGIRAPLKGDAAYVGMEVQVLDNTAPVYAHLQPYQYHGSVYGVIPARRGFLKPVGEWNSEEIIAKGSHIRVILNGHVIVDGDIKEASKNGTMDHKDHPGLQREKGHIGFLGHGDVVFFRNIRIKEL